MITEKMLKRAVWIMAGIILLLVFFFTCRRDPAPQKTVYVPTIKQVVKELHVDTTRIQKRADSAAADARKWKAAATTLKGKLEQSQKFNEELLNSAPGYLAGNPDSAYLHSKIDQLQAAVQASDIICNATVAAQDSALSAEAERLAAAQELSSKLRESLNLSISIASANEVNAKHWKKQTKKARASNTALKIIAIAAGVVAIKQSL